VEAQAPSQDEHPWHRPALEILFHGFEEEKLAGKSSQSTWIIIYCSY
jgi:hypothetical protein